MCDSGLGSVTENTHTHTHTHAYMYMYVCVYIYIYLSGALVGLLENFKYGL